MHYRLKERVPSTFIQDESIFM